MQERRHAGPLLLSTSSWGDFELELFETLMKQNDFTGEQLVRLREQACLGPSPWSRGLVDSLEAQVVPEGNDHNDVPNWLKASHFTERLSR